MNYDEKQRIYAKDGSFKVMSINEMRQELLDILNKKAELLPGHYWDVEIIQEGIVTRLKARPKKIQ